RKEGIGRETIFDRIHLYSNISMYIRFRVYSDKLDINAGSCRLSLFGRRAADTGLSCKTATSVHRPPRSLQGTRLAPAPRNGPPSRNPVRNRAGTRAPFAARRAGSQRGTAGRSPVSACPGN